MIDMDACSDHEGNEGDDGPRRDGPGSGSGAPRTARLPATGACGPGRLRRGAGHVPAPCVVVSLPPFAACVWYPTPSTARRRHAGVAAGRSPG